MISEADTSHACQFVVPGLENGKITRFLISFRPFDTDIIYFDYTQIGGSNHPENLFQFTVSTPISP